MELNQVNIKIPYNFFFNENSFCINRVNLSLTIFMAEKDTLIAIVDVERVKTSQNRLLIK